MAQAASAISSVRILRRDALLAAGALAGGAPASADPSAARETLEERLRGLEGDREFVRRANIGGEFMDAAAQERVREIAARHAFRDVAGTQRALLSAEKSKTSSSRAER